jgi:hypothetical protein
MRCLSHAQEIGHAFERMDLRRFHAFDGKVVGPAKMGVEIGIGNGHVEERIIDFAQK